MLMKRSIVQALMCMAILLFSSGTYAQDQKFFDPLKAVANEKHDQCGFDHVKEISLKEHGGEGSLFDIQQEVLQKILAARGQEDRAANGGNGVVDCEDTYRIPVVWYVVHNGSQGFVSEQRILANMDVLNSHYLGSGIEFCLATQYNGGSIPTPAVSGGVTAVTQSTANPGLMWVDHPYLAATYQGATSPQHPMLTGLSVLPEDRYLRIFVVPDAHQGAGWTYLPGFAPTNQDGIFMSHYTIGDVATCVGNCYSGYEWGHVLTHEAGHYLNLLHIFDGGCSGGLSTDCKTAGDQVCDTPPTVGGGGSGCIGTINSCTNDVPDLPDLLNNHMDYWEDVCRTDFTQGQYFRMRMACYTYRSLMASDANQTYTGTLCQAPTWSCDLNPDFTSAVDADDCDIIFTDTSSPGGSSTIACYLWDFGDGSTSMDPNPTHSYTQPGTYTVCLTVTGYDSSSQEYCECCICYDVVVACTNPPCDADACVNATLIGPLQYQFDALCSSTNGSVTYLWDFGDSTPTSTSANPTHTYLNHGSYFVHLTITVTINGVTCTDDTWYWITVSQACAPVANFTATPNGDCSITFNNTSTNGWPYVILNSIWDFGDGSPTANSYSANHTYLSPGTYTVCLTITVSDGVTTCTDSICQQITVSCSGDACYAEPDFTITDLGSCKFQFDDFTGIYNSTQIVQWDWTYGNGNIGSGTPVIHQYTANGVYQICLTITCVDVMGNYCTYSICKLIEVNCTGTNCVPNAQFTLSATSLCCWDFAAIDQSGNSQSCSSWNVTDALGTLVYSVNGYSGTFCPTENGTYTICYTACCINSDGSTNTATHCETIDVTCFCIPNADFILVDLGDCCYEFTALGADPNADQCSTWTIFDNLGGVTATSTGLTYAQCFAISGTYQVCFETCCTNANGTVTFTQTCQLLEVECGCPEPCELAPRFLWQMHPITQSDGCCMDFFDLSIPGLSSTITGYLWDFGDGNTSTSPNPSHCYTTPNVYNVCLTISGYSPDGQCDETFCWQVICDCMDTCPGDLSGDGFVDLTDLLLFLGTYGQTCP
jgi:PKD repeat protein